jgi:hypothetical protein
MVQWVFQVWKVPLVLLALLVQMEHQAHRVEMVQWVFQVWKVPLVLLVKQGHPVVRELPVAMAQSDCLVSVVVPVPQVKPELLELLVATVLWDYQAHKVKVVHQVFRVHRVHQVHQVVMVLWDCLDLRAKVVHLVRPVQQEHLVPRVVRVHRVEMVQWAFLVLKVKAVVQEYQERQVLVVHQVVTE